MQPLRFVAESEEMLLVMTQRGVISRLALWAGWLLLGMGAAIGWGYPLLARALGWQSPLAIAQTAISSGTFLSAELTALAVLIAVVIGFNVTLLQLAGQAHSLRVTQGILVSLGPFLFAWLLVSAVTLIYFIVPLPDVAQIWQEVLWFLAVTALMLEYLWDFSRRISSEYLAARALRDLGHHPITAWETHNAHPVLQSMIAGAVQRNDLAGMRTLFISIGAFLATYRDAEAERSPRFDRRRYRALRNLLITAAQQLDRAPDAVAYWLGFAEAGYLLQSVACGQHGDDNEHSLFGSLLRDMQQSPTRMVALLTGIRHHLLRQVEAPPLLASYWRARGDWSRDDPRLTTEVAAALAKLYVEAERRFVQHQEDEVAREKAPTLIGDLYAMFSSDFLPVAQAAGPQAMRLTERLLVSLHQQIDAHRQTKPDQIPDQAQALSDEAFDQALAAYQTPHPGEQGRDESRPSTDFP